MSIEPGRHALLADDAADFADAASALLSDVAQRASIASAARAWAVDNLGSQKTALAYESLYDALVNATPSERAHTDA
jgi:glycosyltransferase involved in cell wall biosynthesis